VFSEGDWGAFLSRELGCAVRVRFGRARQRVLEARPRPGGAMEIRLSGFFAEAPPDVRDAVARWLRVGRRARRASDLLDAWIEQSVVSLPPSPRRARRLRTRGRHHDLTRLADEARRGQDLDVTPWPAITWGRRTGSRARHSLQLGCFVPSEHLIRVHPVLDQAWVPAWFVRYVLFHELLHAALPADGASPSRRVHHGPDFRRREEAYPDYPRAVAWQARNLAELLRAARAMGREGGHRSVSAERASAAHAVGSAWSRMRQGSLPF
jgi:hypothetical protein